jgi:hypothetical protein
MEVDTTLRTPTVGSKRSREEVEEASPPDPFILSHQNSALKLHLYECSKNVNEFESRAATIVMKG